jgi:WD40 repeat protein
VSTGQEVIDELSGHSSFVMSVAWSPDGKKLATGSTDITVRLWSVSSGQETILAGHTSFVLSLAMSHDGRHMASSTGDCALRIWDLGSSPTELCTLGNNTSAFTCLAFNSNSSCLASGTQDGSVKVWKFTPSLKALEQLCTMTKHSAWVHCVEWSSSDKYIVSWSWDNTVLIWGTTAENWAMYQLVADTLSFTDIRDEVSNIMQRAGEASRHEIWAGDYCLCFLKDCVSIHSLEERDQTHSKRGELITKYCAPSNIRCIACFKETICVGCEDGQVLFLQAPLLLWPI